MLKRDMDSIERPMTQVFRKIPGQAAGPADDQVTRFSETRSNMQDSATLAADLAADLAVFFNPRSYTRRIELDHHEELDISQRRYSQATHQALSQRFSLWLSLDYFRFLEHEDSEDDSGPKGTDCGPRGMNSFSDCSDDEAEQEMLSVSLSVHHRRFPERFKRRAARHGISQLIRRLP